MTELPSQSIQKYLSDKDKTESSSTNPVKSKIQSDKSSKRISSKEKRKASDGRSKSISEVLTQRVSLTRNQTRIENDTFDEEDEYLTRAREKRRFYDRRQSTPVTFIAESLNKLALSKQTILCLIYLSETYIL